jgi:hypothetical protein
VSVMVLFKLKPIKDLKVDYQNVNGAGFETRQAIKSLIITAVFILLYLLGKHILKVYKNFEIPSITITRGENNILIQTICLSKNKESSSS